MLHIYTFVINHVEVRGHYLLEGKSQMDIVNRSREGDLGFLANVSAVYCKSRVKWYCCDLQSKLSPGCPGNDPTLLGAATLVCSSRGNPPTAVLSCGWPSYHPKVRQGSAPWHPGDSTRQIGRLLGTVSLLSFSWEHSVALHRVTAQWHCSGPQDLRGLMLSQGRWSVTSMLDKWNSASLCQLITYLFPQSGEICDAETLSWPLNNLYFMQKELKS